MRVGQARYSRKLRKRAVMVTFRYSADVNTCMKNEYRLGDSAYAVDRDYPYEVQQARKKLWPDFKRLGKEHRSAAKLIFPATIIVGGRIVCDEFPGWENLINGRVVNVVNNIQSTQSAPNSS